jgi:hypothetical protein
MKPISDQGPYYAVMLGAGTLDTKGGPKINAKGQMLDIDERPIPAGEAYFAAGSTLGPALTFGAVAARHAVAENLRSAS